MLRHAKLTHFVAVVLVTACGRVGYDPLDAGSDAGLPQDAPSELPVDASGDSADAEPDAAGADTGTDAWTPDACIDWDVAIVECAAPTEDPTLFERNWELDCVSQRREAAEPCYEEWVAYASCRGLGMRETCDLGETHTRCAEDDLEGRLRCCELPASCGSL